LLRVGISPKAELRLEATYRREDDRTGDRLLQQDKGLSTVRAGTKLNFTESQGAWPEVSLLAMAELPLGEDAFEPRKVAPQALVLFTNKISEKVQLQYNAG
jgi:hypothetical protein